MIMIHDEIRLLSFWFIKSRYDQINIRALLFSLEPLLRVLGPHDSHPTTTGRPGPVEVCLKDWLDPGLSHVTPPDDEVAALAMRW